MTTHFTSGLTNVPAGHTLGQYGAPAPMAWHEFFTDFDSYTAAHWTVTAVEAGASSASQTLADADGGVLVLTNDTADDDACFLQLAKTTFALEVGKRTIFSARFKVSDATQSDVIVGLQARDTSPLDVTDGVFFLKSDGAATLDFRVEKANVADVAPAVATLANDTFVTVGFDYDGERQVAYFVNDRKLGTLGVANLPTALLTISFGVQNGEAASKSLSVDYVFAAKQR